MSIEILVFYFSDSFLFIELKMNSCEIKQIAEYCEQTLDLDNAKLGEEYFYQSLPLCVIDAVYSRGVKYRSTQNVVERYCEKYNLQRVRVNKESIPVVGEQQSMEDFICKISKVGVEKFMLDVFKNKQMTSTRGGIRKAEAVFRFANVLKDYGINYLQDIPGSQNLEFEREIASIPGQRIEGSLNYFFMLAGSDERINPNKKILDYLQCILENNVTPKKAQMLLTQTCLELNDNYPALTPRLLDYMIWNYVE